MSCTVRIVTLTTLSRSLCRLIVPPPASGDHLIDDKRHYHQEDCSNDVIDFMLFDAIKEA